MKKLSEKSFYGWWMVFAGSIILFVSSGIGFYGHGVILEPLQNAHGWSKGIVSSAISLYFVAYGLMGMIIGRKIDQYGPKQVLVIGSIAMGLGLSILSFIHEIWQLYVVYFLMSIGFACTNLPPVNTLITNWFIRKRGLALSITNTGLSVGGVLLVPLASFLVITWGLEVALPTLGAIYCIFIIPTAIFFIKQRPSEIGQFPDGSPPLARDSAGMETTAGHDAQTQIWTRLQAMRTPAFWSITIAFMLGLGAQIAFLVHQVSFLGKYLGPQGAATAVSITAGTSIFGRLLLGLIVDRCNKRYVTMACFLMQAAAVLTLAYFDNVGILYFCTFIFGLNMGSLIMMQSLIIGECFGLVSFATVFGTVGLFAMPGAAFGPMIAGVIYDATQSYQAAFTIFAVASLVAACVICFARPPGRPR